MEEKKKKDGKRNVLPPRDERFVEAMRNPVFRRVPRREKKVDIDKRFQSMFHVSSTYGLDFKWLAISLSRYRD
jgi:hypothetical protein